MTALTKEHDIEDAGTAWFGEQVSLQQVLIGRVEQAARHAGLVNMLRRLIDWLIDWLIDRLIDRPPRAIERTEQVLPLLPHQI
jgi:hypothetical protein